MKVAENNNSLSSLNPALKRTHTKVTTSDPIPQGKETQREPASAVAISGNTLMKQRLFYIDDPRKEAPLQTVITTTTRMGLKSHFLTQADREFIAGVYEYAQEQGADLTFVDSLGFNLADYRQDNNGKITGPHNGYQYTTEGYLRTYHFTDKDAATAKRIREGEALNSTELDRAFILRMTDENYSGIHHPNFDFLEKVINRFSAKGDSGAPLGPAFAQYKEMKANYIERISKDIRLPRSTASAEGPSAEALNSKGKAKKTSNPDTDLRQLLRAILRRSAARIPSLFYLMFKSRR
jgi:hypothetical protein